MTATTKVESLTPFTWNECNFTWNSDIANKPFDELGCLTYSMTATEAVGVARKHSVRLSRCFKDNLSVIERTPTKSIKKKQKETLKLSDIGKKTLSKKAKELFALNEKYNKNSSIHILENIVLLELASRTIVILKKESLKSSEKLAKNTKRNFKHTILISDKEEKRTSLSEEESFKLSDKEPYKRLVVNKFENILLAEVYWDIMNFYLKVIENITFQETPSKRATRKFSDVFSIKDRANRHENKVSKDNFIVADKNFNDLSVTRKDNFNLLDSKALNSNVIMKDYIQVVDNLSKDTLHKFYEAIETTDRLIKTIITIEYDSFSIVDKRNSALEKLSTEHLEIKESLLKDSKVNVKELLKVVDKLNKQAIFYRNLIESISVSDRPLKNTNKVSEDSISIKDIISKVAEIVASEFIDIEDVAKLKKIFKREFTETVNIAELPRKRFFSIQKEQILMLERFIRASNAILSNIELDADEMTFEQFLEATNKAPGYGKFSDFNVGEYEYQKALVRILVSSNEINTTPLIYGVEHRVDIDDTDDRGTVTIIDTTQPTKVYYNKHYYNAPEVGVTLKGGTQGGGEIVIPNVISTNGSDTQGRFFTVELLNASNVRVSGTITWISKGY